MDVGSLQKEKINETEMEMEKTKLDSLSSPISMTTDSTTLKNSENSSSTSTTLEIQTKKRKNKKPHPSLVGTGASVHASDSASSSLVTWTYQECPALKAMSLTTMEAYYQKHSITIHQTHGHVYKPILQFDQLGFPKAWSHDWFSTFPSPTPIQSVVWSCLFQTSKDLVAIAETGSGKTLAFGIPLLVHVIQTLHEKKHTQKKKETPHACTRRSGFPLQPFGLILLPTRELAMQVHEVLDQLGRPYALTCACVYGGTSKRDQKQALAALSLNNHPSSGGVDVLVATPGRLLDYLREGSCDGSQVSVFILDECDRMLDLGFEHALREVVDHLPPLHQRRTWMFSATWPTSIQQLAATFLNAPVHVTVGHAHLNASSTVQQHVHVVHSDHEKRSYLLKLLNQWCPSSSSSLTTKYTSKNSSSSSSSSNALSNASSPPKILVFALYKAEAQRLYDTLLRQGYSVGVLHGDVPQHQRTQALQRFRSGEVPVLVATDVAARGLDIPHVTYVVNVTFPLTIEDYVHRIGRTGRAGHVGEAHTLFMDPGDKAHAGALIQVLKQSHQHVPPSLLKFGTTVKKKLHAQYGAFYKPIEQGNGGAGGVVKPTKIVFASDDEEN
ncbi:RNA-dependent ATPase [Coelomomyces lativittatus]|nr:RNA-dependent ATPase [Coelomomyces lativittatus]